MGLLVYWVWSIFSLGSCNLHWQVQGVVIGRSLCYQKKTFHKINASGQLNDLGLNQSLNSPLQICCHCNFLLSYYQMVQVASVVSYFFHITLPWFFQSLFVFFKTSLFTASKFSIFSLRSTTFSLEPVLRFLISYFTSFRFQKLRPHIVKFQIRMKLFSRLSFLSLLVSSGTFR